MLDDLTALKKHDFIKTSQSDYFKKLKKKELQKGEYLVCLDFAENYTFNVQNAIQAYHWAAKQATLHPFVIYYRQNNVTNHINYVVVSENLHHDANSVHLFNSKMIAHLKKSFGSDNVKKIFYFSDGAGSQYKNKYNFLNLCYHEEEFGVKAEWNFFASSHGKGACDGIGGTVKRLAKKESLQRVESQRITTPKILFDWAISYFKNISFDFCTIEDHIKHDENMKSRYLMAQNVTGTQKFHFFSPVDKQTINCKDFANDVKSVHKNVIEQERKAPKKSRKTPKKCSETPRKSSKTSKKIIATPKKARKSRNK